MCWFHSTFTIYEEAENAISANHHQDQQKMMEDGEVEDDDTKKLRVRAVKRKDHLVRTRFHYQRTLTLSAAPVVLCRKISIAGQQKEA